MCIRLSSEKLKFQGNCDSAPRFQSCKEVEDYIKELSTHLKLPNTRYFEQDELRHLVFASSLASADQECQCSPEAVPSSRLAVELFRCLRNSCVQCYHNQSEIRRFKSLYNSVFECFTKQMRRVENSGKGHGDVSETEILSVRCGLQFFGNFVVGNAENQKVVWGEFCNTADSIVRCLLNFQDERVVDYASMLLYNVLNQENLDFLVADKCHLIKITQSLISSFIGVKSHWSLLSLERLCEHPSFWEAYLQLTTRERLLVLDIIAEQMSKDSPTVSERLISELADWFEDSVLDIVKFITELDNEKPLEIMRSLCVLCSCSVLPKYQAVQQNVKLLEATVNVLKAVHILGKTSSNVFSPVQSLGARSRSGEDPQNSPAYGFKKDLVRLIGNMCSGQQKCQDLLRHLDGIPLLLDCCNMDAKNPYIMQWCTLAIRNAMENNKDNQAVLASLTVTGQLVDSPLLRELGLNVQQEDSGKISLHKT